MAYILVDKMDRRVGKGSLVCVCVCGGGIDAYPHMYPVSTHIPYYSSLGGCHSWEGWER